ncbi:putative disease resistance protein [Trifolium repens]|nr:putative disease resistance protein [Trifolium repens]
MLVLSETVTQNTSLKVVFLLTSFSTRVASKVFPTPPIPYIPITNTLSSSTSFNTSLIFSSNSCPTYSVDKVRGFSSLCRFSFWINSLIAWLSFKLIAATVIPFISCNFLSHTLTFHLHFLPRDSNH